jgi:hypothetical protein
MTSAAASPIAPFPSSSLGVQWSLPHDAFPRVCGLLDLPEYAAAIAQVGHERVVIESCYGMSAGAQGV